MRTRTLRRLWKKSSILALAVIASIAVVPPLHADPATVITVVKTGVDLMKEINAQNRATREAKQFADIIGRLDYMQQHIDIIEQKLDIAIGEIRQLQQRNEEQWQLTMRSEVLGAIDSVHQYYPGWRKTCVQGDTIACDNATREQITVFHADLVRAISEFRRKDDYTNIHLVVLAMGYERDLLVLLHGEVHFPAVFTSYAKYLEGGIPHFRKLREGAENQMAKLESNAEPWNTTGDYCATSENVFIDHGNNVECRYCVVRYFRGSYLDNPPWVFQDGFAARDGQGSNHCIDNKKIDKDGPKHDPIHLISYRPPMLAYIPIEPYSCESARQHRNCATLQSIIETRKDHDALKTKTIPSIDDLIGEINKSIAFAKELATQSQAGR